MQSRGSELGSVGLAETQVFFVWPNLPLPGLDPEKLLVLASCIETHRLEPDGTSRERRGV